MNDLDPEASLTPDEHVFATVFHAAATAKIFEQWDAMVVLDAVLDALKDGSIGDLSFHLETVWRERRASV